MVLAAHEGARRVWCFVLDVWGYEVFPARTPAELEQIVDAQWICAIVAVLPGPGGRAALTRAQKLGTPVMSLDAVGNAPGSRANVSLSFKAAPMEVRERLRPLTASKRGPKKHPHGGYCDACRRIVGARAS